MTEKRLTKHQLKEDPLVTGAFRARSYLAENKERFLWGLLILGALVLASIWFVNGRREKAQIAETLLTRANIEFQSGQVTLALQDYRQLAEKHTGTPAGREALYYLANAYFQLADFNQAESFYGRYLDNPGNPISAASAHAGLAECYEKKGKIKEAAENFMKAVETSDNNFGTPDYLTGAIKNYSALGDSAQARSLLTRLRQDFPVYRDQIHSALLYMGLHGISEEP